MERIFLVVLVAFVLGLILLRSAPTESPTRRVDIRVGVRAWEGRKGGRKQTLTKIPAPKLWRSTWPLTAAAGCIGATNGAGTIELYQEMAPVTAAAAVKHVTVAAFLRQERRMIKLDKPISHFCYNLTTTPSGPSNSITSLTSGHNKCSFTTGPLSNQKSPCAGKPASGDNVTVLIRPTHTELILGNFHQGLNKHQAYSMALHLLGNKSALTSLGVVPPQKVGRVLLFAGKGWCNVWTPLVHRMTELMCAVITEQFDVACEFVGKPTKNKHDKTDFEPFQGRMWTFQSDAQLVTLYVNPDHAELLRLKAFGSPPRPSVLDPDSVDVVLINRNLKYGRHIHDGDKVLKSVSKWLQSADYRVGDVHEIFDIGHLNNSQADVLYNYSVILSTHGHQMSNILYAPRCAVVIEVMPHGSYMPYYNNFGSQSGHIYGVLYVTEATKNCANVAYYEKNTGGLPLPNTSAKRPMPQCMLGVQNHGCARGQNVNIDPEDVTLILQELLPLRRQCLHHGFDSIPVPDIRALEEEFCEPWNAPPKFRNLYKQ
mmetsp:Transcript_27417/g.71982  ORF Transcript_27417/g.71982 Transcript_27417/m.71982 type:complete len:541 (+) Transcript_27417:104-1726(+)